MTQIIFHQHLIPFKKEFTEAEVKFIYDQLVRLLQFMRKRRVKYWVKRLDYLSSRLLHMPEISADEINRSFESLYQACRVQPAKTQKASKGNASSQKKTQAP